MALFLAAIPAVSTCKQWQAPRTPSADWNPCDQEFNRVMFLKPVVVNDGRGRFTAHASIQ